MKFAQFFLNNNQKNHIANIMAAIPISAAMWIYRLWADEPALANWISWFRTTGKLPMPTPSSGCCLIDSQLAFQIAILWALDVSPKSTIDRTLLPSNHQSPLL